VAGLPSSAEAVESQHARGGEAHDQSPPSVKARPVSNRTASVGRGTGNGKVENNPAKSQREAISREIRERDRCPNHVRHRPQSSRTQEGKRRTRGGAAGVRSVPGKRVVA